MEKPFVHLHPGSNTITNPTIVQLKGNTLKPYSFGRLIVKVNNFIRPQMKIYQTNVNEEQRAFETTSP